MYIEVINLRTWKYLKDGLIQLLPPPPRPFKKEDTEVTHVRAFIHLVAKPGLRYRSINLRLEKNYISSLVLYIMQGDLKEPSKQLLSNNHSLQGNICSILFWHFREERESLIFLICKIIPKCMFIEFLRKWKLFSYDRSCLCMNRTYTTQSLKPASYILGVLKS